MYDYFSQIIFNLKQLIDITQFYETQLVCCNLKNMNILESYS